VPSVFKRALALFRRSRIDADLREELEDHVDLRRRQLIEDGMDADTARREAVRMFGNVTALRETSRDAWTFPPFESLLQDVRFGIRLLAHTPLFTAVGVLSLAVGIGSAVAIFNIADAVLFRPLPVRAAQELRAFRVEMRMGAASKIVNGVPEEAFAGLQREAEFADYIGFRRSGEVFLDEGTRVVRVEFASPRYFEVLGVQPRVGRLLTDIDHSGDAPVAVLTEPLWRAAYNNDPAIVGRTIRLNGQATTVIGVARHFNGLVADRSADAFVPLRATRAIDPPSSNFSITLVARLHPGITTAVAEQRHAALYRVGMPSGRAPMELRTTVVDASRGISEARELLAQPLWLGLALAGVLVLVACANTGALLLSRFVSRRGEFGIRIAIGAGRLRLARQLAIESLLLSGCAGGVALVTGWGAAPWLMRLLPDGSGTTFELRFDYRLVIFTAGTAAACAAGAVIASLVRLSRSDVSSWISTESRTIAAGSRRAIRLLIGTQVAASLLLAIGAISLARSVWNLGDVPVGFDPRRTLFVDVNAAGLMDSSKAAAYHGALRNRLASTPGIERATLAQFGLLTAAATTGTVDAEGFTPATDDDRLSRMFFVGPEYFETLGMRLLAGRVLTERDITDPPRAIVINQRFAAFYFGGTHEALGRTVNGNLHVVGVVAEAHYSTLRGDESRAMFVSYMPMQRAHMTHVIRTRGPADASGAAVRAVVASHDARLHPQLTTGEQIITAAVARETFLATVSTVLATMAITLACAGLYAAQSYAVSQRRGELAVRLALGASSRDVLRLVLRDPVATTLAGIVAGIPAAYLVMRTARSLLFGVPVFDLTIVAACSAALLAAGLVAAAFPARRASRIDPVAALRN
jgi:predicted permease